jgi:hypothetical protein
MPLAVQVHPGKHNDDACREPRHDARAAAWKRSLALRIALAAAFVLFCHAFEWHWLRLLTTSTVVPISAALGVPVRRLGWDLLAVGALRLQVALSCTLVEAFLGAAPLLWRSSLGVVRNLLRLAVAALALFGVNILRLEIGFVGLNWGLPWWLVHECVLGLTFFAILMFIVRDWRKLEPFPRFVRLDNSGLKTESPMPSSFQGISG